MKCSRLAQVAPSKELSGTRCSHNSLSTGPTLDGYADSVCLGPSHPPQYCQFGSSVSELPGTRKMRAAETSHNAPVIWPWETFSGRGDITIATMDGYLGKRRRGVCMASEDPRECVSLFKSSLFLLSKLQGPRLSCYQPESVRGDGEKSLF